MRNPGSIPAKLAEREAMRLWHIERSNAPARLSKKTVVGTRRVGEIPRDLPRHINGLGESAGGTGHIERGDITVCQPEKTVSVANRIGVIPRDVVVVVNGYSGRRDRTRRIENCILLCVTGDG